MKAVIDSSVAFKWGINEADSPKAKIVMDDFVGAVHELLAPDVFPIELTHAITRAERQGRITSAEGSQFFTRMLSLLPILHHSIPLLPRAYEISSSMRIGVYDCLYLSLAEREGCELITGDEKLARVAKASFPFVVPLSALP